MSDQPQSYASHKRYLPSFHFFVLPVFLADVIVTAIAALRSGTATAAWRVVVAVALLTAVYLSRHMALTAQTRVIRLEEQLRLSRLLPGGQLSALAQLTTDHLVALRFASDGEIPDLVRRVAAGELRTKTEIKRAIRSWRADELRV